MATTGSAGSDEFNKTRAEAEDVLRRVLRDTSAIDDGMQAMNAAADRARALAQLDCWAPRWLQAAFQEVDRLQRWNDLRARQVQAVLDLHAPVDVEQVWGPMEANWLPPVVCAECNTPFPCNTREAALDSEPQPNL